MKLTIVAADLKAALDVASKTVGKAAYAPTIAMVLCEATLDGGLRLTGTNLDTRSWRTAQANVVREGSVCLPPDRLASVLDVCGDGDQITIDVDDTNRARITSGRAVTRCTGLPAEGFPVAPSFDEPLCDLTLSAAVLADTIMAVLHAAAKDQSRPVLAGVLFSIADGELTCAAADGFRLAIRSVKTDADADLNVIVDGKPLATITKALEGATSARVTVDARTSMLAIDSEAGCWAVKLIDGQFPDFRRVIPRDPTTTATVSKAALLGAIKLTRGITSTFTEGDKTISGVSIKLTVSEASIEARAGDAASDTEAVIELDAEVYGPAITIGFNGKYLDDAVSAIDGPNVCLKLTGHQSPAIVVHPDDVHNESPQICMPMSVAR
jgi:DNA polymerase-3 subunit beta